MGAKREPTRRAACEILAAVMKGPRTRREVAEMTGSGEASSRAWLTEFHNAGVFYVLTWRRRAGGAEAVYAFQATPFEVADEPRPAPRRNRVARRPIVAPSILALRNNVWKPHD